MPMKTMAAPALVSARIMRPALPGPPPPFVAGTLLMRRLTSMSRPTDWKT
jgi:hypothetical protein